VTDRVDVRPRLATILGHLSLSLLTANIIPAVLFYVCLVNVGVWAALVAALVWCYGVVSWRIVTRRRASGLLMLTVSVLTVRTIVALASGDTFLYFLQPVLSDIVVATAFLVSLATARPVVARLAADFYPMSDDLARRPRVQQLFWRLTLLWALVCIGKAGISFWLLQTQSVAAFVLTKNLALLTLTALATVATVAAATAVARKEGLLGVAALGQAQREAAC
jgi:hypothetical protein